MPLKNPLHKVCLKRHLLTSIINNLILIKSSVLKIRNPVGSKFNIILLHVLNHLYQRSLPMECFLIRMERLTVSHSLQHIFC